MAARKTERLVNLTILLLSSRRFLPKHHIRAVVEGYRDMSDEAFDRMFERDKDELRSLGVPIDTGSNDAFFDDETGYRISRRDFELPTIEFTPDEVTVLGLASTVWQQASAADDTTHALAKLRATGIDPDASRLTALAPRLSAREEAFEPLWQAVIDRQAVEFTYLGADELRTVEPWRLAWRTNSWYLVGLDRGRQAPRVFKLSRITGDVRTSGGQDAFEVPEDAVVTEHAGILTARTSDLTAVLAIRGERVPAMRRRGETCAAPVDLPAGFRAYRVPFTSGYAASEIASHGPDVIVLEPADLREQVVRHLRGVLRVHCRPDELAQDS